MRMLFVESLRKGLPTLLMACALTACGPSESQNGGAIFTWNLTISPASFALMVPADTNMPPSPTPCSSNPASFSDFPFVITVTNEDGVPLGNVDLDLVLDFAPGLMNFSAGGAPLGVSSLSTTTDDDGTATIFLQFLVAAGCTYAGSLNVKSGALFTQAAFDVTAQ